MGVPSWIDRQSSKGKRKAGHDAARAALHATWMERSKAAAAYEKELVAERREARTEAKRRALVPGERLLPTICDDELGLQAAKADPGPQLLAYPHLLILRQRGFTTQVWETAEGALAATYRGDRITEDGRAWLERLRG